MNNRYLEIEKYVDNLVVSSWPDKPMWNIEIANKKEKSHYRGATP